MFNICPTCGSAFQKGVYLANENAYLCERCGMAAYKCQTCQHARCSLRNYQGPKPLYIMQTRQQGPMTIQQQVINPEVIKDCCETCKCFNNGVCFQTCGSCENFVLFRRDEEKE